MLQIFNAHEGFEEDASAIVSIEQSPESPESPGQSELARSTRDKLVQQLHCETEKRFFLEEALDLLDFQTGEDSSSLTNVLNLLNRTAGTQRILIASSDGQLIASSFCSGEYQEDMTIGTITWLIDQAVRVCQKHNNDSKISVSRLTVSEEALTMPLSNSSTEKHWMIVTGGDSQTRSLKDQQQLFESARRLFERLLSQLV